MVVSNHSRLPGIIVKGKEKPFERPQAGMIFYNDEGSESDRAVQAIKTRTPASILVEWQISCPKWLCAPTGTFRA
jgi:hypothetical protein